MQGTDREQCDSLGVVNMLVLDPLMVVALAAVITSLSAFVWAVRRKP